MSSRMMKTYSRQKVCQSSIQFDQLLNDKSNKPSAAKSKGTLHRWGMTSFTSMRNASQLNGRKDKTDGGSGDNAGTNSSVSRFLSKRRRTNQPPVASSEASSDDPFSFEAEADATMAAAAARSSPQPTAATVGRYPPSEAAARSNKFFKSGARSSAFRAARPHLAEGEMIVEAVELPAHCYNAADLINLAMHQPVELIKPQQHPATTLHIQQQQPQQHIPVQDAFSMLLSSTGVTGEYDTLYGNLGSIKQPTPSVSSAANLNLFANYAVSQPTYSTYGTSSAATTTTTPAAITSAGSIFAGHSVYGLDPSYDQAKLAAVYGTVQMPIATSPAVMSHHPHHHHHHQVAFDEEAAAAELLYSSDAGRNRIKEDQQQQQLFIVDHGLAPDVAQSQTNKTQSVVESLYAEQLLTSPVKSGHVSTVSYSDRLSLGLSVKNDEIMYNERLNLAQQPHQHHHSSKPPAEDLDYGLTAAVAAKSAENTYSERLTYAHKSSEQPGSVDRYKVVKEHGAGAATSYSERGGGSGSKSSEPVVFAPHRLAPDMSQKSGTGSGHVVYVDATMDLSAKMPCEQQQQQHHHPTPYGDHLALELASKTNLTYCPQEVTLDLTSPTKVLSAAGRTVYGRSDVETDENAFRKSINYADMAHGGSDVIKQQQQQQQQAQQQADFGEQLAYQLVASKGHQLVGQSDPMAAYKAELIAAAAYERNTHAQLLLDAGRPRLATTVPVASTYHQSPGVDQHQLQSPGDGDAGSYQSPEVSDDTRSPDPPNYQSPSPAGVQIPSDVGHQYQSSSAMPADSQQQHYQVAAASPEVTQPQVAEQYPNSDAAHFPTTEYRSTARSDMLDERCMEQQQQETDYRAQEATGQRESFEPPDSRFSAATTATSADPVRVQPDQTDVVGAEQQRESVAARSGENSGASSGAEEEEDYDENSCDSVQRSSASVSSGAPLDKEEEEELLEGEQDSGEEADPPTEAGPKLVPPKKSYTMNQSRMKASHHASSLLRQRRIFNSPKKIDRKSLYKHRPWQVEEEPVDDKEAPSTSSSQPTLADEFDDLEDEVSAQRPTLTRVTTWPTRLGDEAVTSVRCPKKFRELYAVVKNVKQAHQCHESGETQEFNDDIEYLLDGVQGTNSVGTRCLSILSLASKCMAPSFRMHLRAHGSLTKVFSALQDAPKDANLSLCTATVMFILSQDRLNMDLDRTSLELMLQLLETESSVSMTTISTTNGHNREYDKNKEKVRELCQEQQKKGYAKLLDLDNITPGVLAMETLLSLTSRRAGEWFKEELRELGGLDHLVNTVGECGQCLPVVVVQLREFALDKLRKLDRCLRVLENVTYMNSQNQAYLITCQNSTLIHYCSRALQLCESCLKVYPNPDINDRESPSWILFNCLLSILKVLLNLTNDNPRGSAALGEQDGLMIAALSCVLYVPSHCETEQRFDILVLSLGLLINLVEHCDVNRHKLLYTELPLTTQSSSHHHRRYPETISAPKALVNLFSEHEEAARLEETKTDNLLDGKGDDDGDASKPQKDKDDAAGAGTSTSTGLQQDDIEETLQKALQKAGKNMENSMIAAYIALLLGCLIQENRDSATRIRDHLPQKDFGGMVQMLKKYLNFMNLTNLVGSKGMKSIQRVIDILENT